MKETCKNCKNAKLLDDKEKELAKGLHEIMSIPKYGRPRKKKWEDERDKKIAALPNSELAAEIHGLGTLTFKDAIPAEKRGEEYVKCSNTNHLADENIADKKYVVHKYYYSCPHFEEV